MALLAGKSPATKLVIMEQVGAANISQSGT
jgi:hypothetical protein